MGSKENKIKRRLTLKAEFPRKIHRLEHKIFDFGGHNVTLKQAQIIHLISLNEDLTQTELGKRMGIRNSTVSGMVDSLVKKGLVRRERSKNDRRVVNLRISEELKQHFSDFSYNTRREFETILANASEQELDDVIKGFETLIALFERRK